VTKPAIDSSALKRAIVLALILIVGVFPLSVSADSTSTKIDSANAMTVVDSSGVSASDTAVASGETGPEAESPEIPAFRVERINALVVMALFSVVILIYTRWARRGKNLFIRKINGLDEVENAVGRATEMGKPVLFIPGIQEIDEIETIAGVSILGRVAKITARYDTPLIVPVRYPMILAAGQEVVEQAYVEEGKADAYNKDMVRYVAGEQFAFSATVNGIMMRDRPATNIYMGAFFAESLLLAETGNAAGSIQIAGTAQPSQLPFFIAACDYTLMGEELYAASAYLSREPLLLGGLKGQDWMKILLVLGILIGVALLSFGVGDWFYDLFQSV